MQEKIITNLWKRLSKKKNLVIAFRCLTLNYTFKMKNFFVTFVLEIQVIFVALFQEVLHFSHTPHSSYHLLPNLTSPSNRWLLHRSQDNAVPWYILIEKEIQYWWILKKMIYPSSKTVLHFELFQDLERMDLIKKSLDRGWNDVFSWK